MINYANNKPVKYLIVQFKPLGDILLTSPVAEFIKREVPSAKVFFLVYKNYKPVIENNRHVDNIIVLEHNKKKTLHQFFNYLKERISLILTLRKLKLDYAFDFIGLPSSAWILFLANVKNRVGYEDLRGRRHLYNVKAPRIYENSYTVLNKYNLLKAVGMDISEPVIDTYLNIPEKDRSFAEDYIKENCPPDRIKVLVSPSSPRPRKKWALSSYAGLCDELINRYKASILLLYGPGEEEDCLALKKLIKGTSLLLPETGIMAAAAFIKASDLAVLNCGGVKHISVAVKTPSITVFGPTNPRVWHPAHLEWARYVSGDPYYPDQSFGISSESVIKELEILREKSFLK